MNDNVRHISFKGDMSMTCPQLLSAATQWPARSVIAGLTFHLVPSSDLNICTANDISHFAN